MQEVVLILDNRKEQSLKNKRILENVGISVFCVSECQNLGMFLTEIEPDLVIVSDKVCENPSELISEIRKHNVNVRPVIIALSKSSHMQDKIDTLNAGADDFISEPINQAEFLARIKAHLRRHFETETDPTTGLVNQKISFKYLKRTINTQKIWAAMLIGINNFDYYKEIYGELASDKMKQTFGAIAKNAIGDDFI